jgi:hypothetical protein
MPSDTAAKPGPTRSPERSYLRDHELGAQAGLRAFRRAAKGHRAQPWGREVAQLAAQVREDLRTEQRILRVRRVRRSRVGAAGAAVGERLGRLKPNGSLVQRTPATDLIEIEGMLAMAQAKRTGWRTLELAGGVPGFDMGALVRRADAQVRRLTVVHEQASARLRTR